MAVVVAAAAHGGAATVEVEVVRVAGAGSVRRTQPVVAVGTGVVETTAVVATTRRQEKVFTTCTNIFNLLI